MHVFSILIPLFLESLIYLGQDANYVLNPEVKAVIKVLEDSRLPHPFLQQFSELHDNKKKWPLPPDDKYDHWLKKQASSQNNNVAVSLHAVSLFVKEESDDVLDDDIYLYFFITEGVIPYGKVSSIYKNIDEGEGIFFNPADRVLFPVTGGAGIPQQHLIVDYGIVESDGDDIKDLQKLSSIIIDLAIAAYGAAQPQSTQVLVSLRKEVLALASLLISFQNDDRLVTSSFGLSAQEINKHLASATVYEFKRKHKKRTRFDTWEYEVMFRFLRI